MNEHGSHQPEIKTDPLDGRISRRSLIRDVFVPVALVAGGALILKQAIDKSPHSVTPSLPEPKVDPWVKRTEVDVKETINKYIREELLARWIRGDIANDYYRRLSSDKRAADYGFFLPQERGRISVAVKNLYEEDGRLSASGLQTYIFRDHALNLQYNLRIAQGNPELAASFCEGNESPEGLMNWTRCYGRVPFEFLHRAASAVYKLPESMNFDLKMETFLSTLVPPPSSYETVGVQTGEAILPDGKRMDLAFDQFGVGTLIITEPFHTPNTSSRDRLKHRFNLGTSNVVFPVLEYPYYTGLNR